MKQILGLVVGVAALASLAGVVRAADMANGCGDVRWKGSVLQKFPGIEKSCVGVVTRDGATYVKVSGKVKSKSKEIVTVTLDHTNSDIKWKPGKGDTVGINGNPMKAMDVAVGQSLHFYVPEDRVAVVDISSTGVNPREVVP